MIWYVLILLILLLSLLVSLYMLRSTEGFTSGECEVLRRIPTNNGIVEIVNSTCQEGLPHTTDSETIRMTDTLWNSPRKDEILVHERIHLDQKRAPHKWTDFYRDVWNYELSSNPPPELPSTIVRNLRPNPDTSKDPWATWRRRYVFFPVYGNGTKKLTAAHVNIWDLVTKSFVAIPVEWKAEFCDSHGCPHQYEHPHELAAELLTLSSTSPAANKLRANISLLNSRYGGNSYRSDRI